MSLFSEREDGLDHRHPGQHGEGAEQGQGPHHRDGAAGVRRGGGAGEGREAAETGMSNLQNTLETVH